eukprot:6952950-Prymnesium_polylepis.1
MDPPPRAARARGRRESRRSPPHTHLQTGGGGGGATRARVSLLSRTRPQREHSGTTRLDSADATRS